MDPCVCCVDGSLLQLCRWVLASVVWMGCCFSCLDRSLQPMLAAGVPGFLAHWLHWSKCHCCLSARQQLTVLLSLDSVYAHSGSRGNTAHTEGACQYKGITNVPVILSINHLTLSLPKTHDLCKQLHGCSGMRHTERKRRMKMQMRCPGGTCASAAQQAWTCCPLSSKKRCCLSSLP